MINKRPSNYIIAELPSCQMETIFNPNKTSGAVVVVMTTYHELDVQLVVLGDAELVLLVPDALPGRRIVVLDHVRGLRRVVAGMDGLVQYLQHEDAVVVVIGVDPLRYPRQEPAGPVVVFGRVEARVVNTLGDDDG